MSWVPGCMACYDSGCSICAPEEEDDDAAKLIRAFSPAYAADGKAPRIVQAHEEPAGSFR